MNPGLWPGGRGWGKGFLLADPRPQRQPLPPHSQAFRPKEPAYAKSRRRGRGSHRVGRAGPSPPALAPLSPFSTASQLISDTRVINKTFARKGDWDSSLPAPPLSYKSIKYSFKIKYKEQKGPALGATCSPQENESTHPSRTCLGDGGAPSRPGPAAGKRKEGRGPAPGPGPEHGRRAHRVQRGTGRERDAPARAGTSRARVRPTEAPREAAAPELRGERGPRSRRGAKEKVLIPFDLGPAGAGGAGGRWGRQRAVPAGGGRSPGARPAHPAHEQPPARVRRTFPAPRAPGPASGAAGVCVQASERPRGVRPRRRLTRAPAGRRATLLSRAPGQGRSGAASPPSPQPRLGLLILTVGAPILVPHGIAGPDAGRGCKLPLQTPGGGCGSSGNAGPCAGRARARGPIRSGNSTAPHRSPTSARPGQRGAAAALSPARPPPPGPRVRCSHHARHTAPALRSAPPSRGAGAGGPKPSWP